MKISSLNQLSGLSATHSAEKVDVASMSAGTEVFKKSLQLYIQIQLCLLKSPALSISMYLVSFVLLNSENGPRSAASDPDSPLTHAPLASYCCELVFSPKQAVLAHLHFSFYNLSPSEMS